MSSNTHPTKERIDAPIAIVVRDRHILITQRKHDDALGGYWEFPGGKCEVGETLEQCLARELREEIDIVASPLQRLDTIEHDYPDAIVCLHPFICAHVQGEPKLIECQDAKWIEPTALLDYKFPPANEALLARVIELMNQAAHG
jgi:mutator protein MutT